MFFLLFFSATEKHSLWLDPIFSLNLLLSHAVRLNFSCADTKITFENSECSMVRVFVFFLSLSLSLPLAFYRSMIVVVVVFSLFISFIAHCWWEFRCWMTSMMVAARWSCRAHLAHSHLTLHSTEYFSKYGPFNFSIPAML